MFCFADKEAVSSDCWQDVDDSCSTARLAAVEQGPSSWTQNNHHFRKSSGKARRHVGSLTDVKLCRSFQNVGLSRWKVKIWNRHSSFQSSESFVMCCWKAIVSPKFLFWPFPADQQANTVSSALLFEVICVTVDTACGSKDVIYCSQGPVFEQSDPDSFPGDGFALGGCQLAAWQRTLGPLRRLVEVWSVQKETLCHLFSSGLDFFISL